jgi:uncharacterized protein YecT (DUF1311 family)
MSPFKDKARNREYQRSWKAAKRAEGDKGIKTLPDESTGPVLSASDRARIDYLHNYIESLKSGSQKGQANEMRELSRHYAEAADRIDAELNTAMENARAELQRLLVGPASLD